MSQISTIFRSLALSLGLSGALILVGCSARATAVPALSGVAGEKHPGMEALIAEMAPNDAARAAQLRDMLNAATYQQAIINAISKPAEGKPWKDYRPIFITNERIKAGHEFLLKHEQLFIEVEQRYGVPREYIAAIIGVETFYGRNVGSWKVLDALTTLGLYYPPRQAYFRGELMQYLNFDRQPSFRFDRLSAVGSYAGAMGLGQFMPTSWVKWSVDYNADGSVDLWRQDADIVASVANYLLDHGWKKDAPVTVQAKTAANPKALGELGLDPVHSLAKFKQWGYESALALDDATLASLLTLEGAAGSERHFIFANFRVITRYNRSPLYAMAVHQLALALAAKS